jgi:hypothetical protein
MTEEGESLTAREAFDAMARFLEAYWDRAQPDAHLEVLLADIELQEDGAPRDPASWADWLVAVRAARERR